MSDLQPGHKSTEIGKYRIIELIGEGAVGALVQDVHIWRASLDRPGSDVAAMHAHLDPAERLRASSFRSQQDRRRFVVARATLRILLGEYLATAPVEVPLIALPGGKPALGRGRAFTRPHFNLAHCGEIALFAFAETDVGIDVERLAAHDDMGRVAAHFFAPDEAEALQRLAGIERIRFFFRTWVRKEAYLKATGAGFSLNPARVHIAAPPAGRITLEDEDGDCRVDDRYAVHDLADIDDHVAAICIAGGDGAPTVFGAGGAEPHRG